jgi:hypothetical protein
MRQTIGGIRMSNTKRYWENETQKWAREENAMRTAIRVKGFGGQVEGWLMDDQSMILVVLPDGDIAGGPTDIIESVWFLGRWMDPEQVLMLR